jgi:TatD DNase family protein
MCWSPSVSPSNFATKPKVFLFLVYIAFLNPSFLIMSTPAPDLVDFCANLLHKDLVKDLDGLVEKAEMAGVQTFVVPGGFISESKEVLALSCARENVIAACGVHPYHAGRTDECNEENLSELTDLILNSKCDAIGETGLDYSEGFPDPTPQLAWFREHISLALRVGKPLYLHERDAHDDFCSVLEEYGFADGAPGPVACAVHCFTGNTEVLQKYVAKDFYIGLTGFVMERIEPETLSEWIGIIPENRLLIETDAPYMGWKGCRSTESKKKNQKYPNLPSALPQVLTKITKCSPVPLSESSLAQSTTLNAMRFFKKLPSVR